MFALQQLGQRLLQQVRLRVVKLDVGRVEFREQVLQFRGGRVTNRAGNPAQAS